MQLSVHAKWYIALVALVVILAGLFLFRMGASAESTTPPVSSTQPIHINWLIAHQPTSVFDTAEKVLASELSKDSDGRITVTILNPADVGYTGNGDVPPAEVHQLLDSGKIQLATVPAADLAGDDPQMLAFTLPFLFPNYPAAQTIMNGPVGATMLSQFSQTTDATALAFTFSGGFLIIPTTDKQIKTAADLKGLKIGTSQGPVEDATLTALGATPVDISIDQLQSALQSGQVDGIVTTYTRMMEWYSPNVHYIYEDNAGLFLTALLASNTFYDSLSDSDKAALMQAAHDAAQAEQADSIALAGTNRATLESEGVIITAPSTATLKEEQSLTQSVYSQFSSVFDSDFVSTIKNAEQ